VFAKATVVERQEQGQVLKYLDTPLGQLRNIRAEELNRYAAGEIEVLLRADDIVHDDLAPVQGKIVRKAFRGNEFLYTLELKSGQQVMAHVPSHHDHQLGEWIGIRAEVDHVVTFGAQGWGARSGLRDEGAGKFA
jgi:iron(III) transport system ATP-binding protein